MTSSLKIQGKPLDRWVEVRARLAQKKMPEFDCLPARIRAALSNMKAGPRWTLIDSVWRSLERGTSIDFLVRRIAKEDEKRLASARESNARGQQPHNST